MRTDGYKPSTIDLNSPEITRLAYSPQMNDHIDQLKAHKKAKSSSFQHDIGQEVADHIRFKDKAPVTCIGSGIRMPELMSNFDRRRLGLEQDESLPDYKPMVDQAKKKQSTNQGALHGSKKQIKARNHVKVQRH